MPATQWRVSSIPPSIGATERREHRRAWRSGWRAARAGAASMRRRIGRWTLWARIPASPAVPHPAARSSRRFRSAPGSRDGPPASDANAAGKDRQSSSTPTTISVVPACAAALSPIRTVPTTAESLPPGAKVIAKSRASDVGRAVVAPTSEPSARYRHLGDESGRHRRQPGRRNRRRHRFRPRPFGIRHFYL